MLDPAAPDCARELGTLDINDTRIYSCNQREISAEFTNVASVQGQDSAGHVAFDEASARVEVANPNVEIIQSPSSQTLLKGEDAIFDVFVINTSSAVDLVDVEVADPLVSDCNRTGAHPFHNLTAGDEVMYQCRLANVSAPFTNVITITGTSLLTQQIVQDSNVAKIELLDLSTSLQANPTSLMSPQGMISLTLTIHNLGSVDVTLTSLTSEKLGSLLDSGNTQLISNNCSSSSLPTLAPAQQFSCTFSGMITGTPPQEEIVITVEAHDVDNNLVTSRATTQITFVNPQVHRIYFPLAADSYAQTDEDNDFPCQAIPISIGHVYRFRPEDQDDWYYFDILQGGPVSVRLRDFIPEDGQLAVWTGTSCSNLDTLVGHNANFLPEKEVSFVAHPDRYYVWISNLDDKAYNTNYTLFVDAP